LANLSLDKHALLCTQRHFVRNPNCLRIISPKRSDIDTNCSFR